MGQPRVLFAAKGPGQPPKKISTATISHMAGAVSQRSIGAMSRFLSLLFDRRSDVRETLYENDFPDWFVRRLQQYAAQWLEMLMDLRKGAFFFAPSNIYVEDYEAIEGVTDDPHWNDDPVDIGEFYIQKLAAFICTQPGSDSVLRSLQLDGFDVDTNRLKLVTLEGPVSAQAEEGRLTRMVKNSGLPQSLVILKHIEDAYSLYAEGKDHPSLNESRSLIQSLIDGISTETNAHRKHSTGLPGPTKDRIEYLTKVGFLEPDLEAAFKSGWGTLSAGSHPGVPEREQARIGLVLALEFGQLLLLKFANWKVNAYCNFS